ncbi:MAG: hypothetical protein JRN52_01955 [Nitrososphaerota archaeon]|nr:hypothetical protein [Nitrososphaerota archaeon]
MPHHQVSTNIPVSDQGKDGHYTSLLKRDDLVLRDTVTDSRVIVMSCSAYRSMCDELYNQFQSGAGVILYRMGEGYASKMFAAFPKLGSSTDDLLRGLERLSYMAGWGRMKARVLDESNMECIAEKSAFVLRRDDIGPTSCYFLSGVLGATASKLFQRQFIAREVSCESGGAKLCRFKIEVKN